MERLAPLTGKENVPPHKQAKFRYVKDKFSVAGLTALPSKKVLAPRVAECPLQMEAIVRGIHFIGEEVDMIAAVEVEILAVHAHQNIIYSPNHIDPQKWRPLIYNFRHYFGLGQEVGKSFRAET